MTRIIHGWQGKIPRTKKPQHPFVPLKASPVSPRMEEHRAMMAKCQSHGVTVGNATVPRGAAYRDPELQRREEAARNVKHTVAPICNKGAYQLITGNDIKTAGRKV